MKLHLPEGFGINKKIVLGILAGFLLLCMFGIVFFFSYFKVVNVEVRGSTRYSDEEIENLVLQGPFAGNSVLAPMFCSEDNVKSLFFVDGYSVTRLSRDSIVISVREKKPVGCIAYLDSYIYFDRNGYFVEGSRNLEQKIPFFHGIEVDNVVEDKKLTMRSAQTVLNTAVTLSTIFQKNDDLPEYVELGENNQINLVYGKITVMLGQANYLEDKMARVIAILPKIEGEEGILHLESVTDHVKTITFEPIEEETDPTDPEAWKGGYDENGDFTGDGEYDKKGRYVGPRPLTDLEYAIAAWGGGYDGEGDYTGSGEYDMYGNYAGVYPTEEIMEANGDWKGGYTEYGTYNGYGEFDRNGVFVGPNPNAGQQTGEDGGEPQEPAEQGKEGEQEQQKTEDGSAQDDDPGIYDESYYDNLYGEEYFDALNGY